MGFLVDIAILTYKRADGLDTCLRSVLSTASVSEPHTLRRVLVIDNDPDQSAAESVATFAEESTSTILYVSEPEPGVTAARNRALKEAQGSDVLVFIDDDEVVVSNWPDGLLDVMQNSEAALVGGPVRSDFAVDPPPFVLKGGYFDRAEPADNAKQPWLRSGNLAIRLAALDGVRFDPAFGATGGEDVAFSITLVDRGHELRWSSTAIVCEEVSSGRLTEEWIATRQRNATRAYYRAHLLVWPRQRVMMRAAVTATRAVLEGIWLSRAFSDETTAVRRKMKFALAMGALEGATHELRPGA